MMKENWTYKKLGEICDVSAGQGAPQGEENYCADGTPFVKAGNIEDLINGLDENCIQKVNEDVAKSHKLKLYKAGSVVFAKSGMSCMKGLVYTLKHDCYVVSHLAILTPKGVDSSFLKYSLNHFKPNTLVKDEAYPSISLGDISKLSIPVPPIEIQSRIVFELDLLQSIIDKQQAQLKELDTLAQSIFYDMFGDPIENEKGWEVKKLGGFATAKIGLTYKPSDVCDDGTIVLRSSNIQQNKIDLDDIVRVNTSIKDGQWVKDGDILMCTRNGSFKLVGKVAMIKKLPEKMTYGAFMTIIRSEYNHYLLAFFRTPAFRRQLGCAGTATINQITVKMLNEILVPLPPLSLQQSFAEKIHVIEKQKAAISKSIEETQKLFDYTMDKYFG